MNILQRPKGRTLNPTHLFQGRYKVWGRGEAGLRQEAAYGSPGMRPQEGKQDSGVVEDILDFNWEHRGCAEAQRESHYRLYQVSESESGVFPSFLSLSLLRSFE